jgi:hypothetical protein
LGGSYTVLWDTASGPINHYTLNEEITLGPGTGTITNYTVTAPTTSKAFTKGTAQRTWTYKVRSCSSSNETSCSAWTATVDIDVCPSSGCP